MKIAFLCQGTVMQPALETLYSQGLLAGMAVPEGREEINSLLETAVQAAHVPFLKVGKSDLERHLEQWLREITPDVVLCMGFPWKIPASLLELPKLGFFNLHGGILPQYRGPDPVFWQIKNREPYGAIAVHRMTKEWDEGGIAHMETVPIDPDDTHGLYMQRLGAVLPRIAIEFVQQLAIYGDGLPLAEQEASIAQYWPRPKTEDITIDWSRPAEEIRALIRACNPIYAGATTLLKGVPVRLLQVTVTDPYKTLPVPPGTIATASGTEGIQVVCGQGEALQLDILYGIDGFFSGKQVVKIFGIRPGDCMS